MWNMNMALIPIVISSLGLVDKDMEKKREEFEIRRIIKTIGFFKLLPSGRIFRIVWRLAVTHSHVKNPLSQAGIKNSQGN